MLRPWLLLAVLLPVAGCMGERPQEDVPTSSTGGDLPTGRFFGAQVDGPVAVQTRFRLDQATTCSVAGFAHHPLSNTYLPDVFWLLDRLGDDGGVPETVAGSPIPIPMGQGRAHIGPVDSRVLTDPAADGAWGAVFSVLHGERASFVSWSGLKDADLEAGTYLLTAYAPRGIRAEANELVGHASLATGVECRDGLTVLSEKYATPAVLLTPYGVEGDLDVGTEVFGPEVHQGSLRFTAVGDDTMLWTGGARMLGEVSYDGPASERLAMDHTDTPNVPLAGQPMPRYWRWLPPGEYELSWDITGVATMFWILGLASYQPAPAEWGEDAWDPPF